MATPHGGDRRRAGSGYPATTGRGALPDGDPRRVGTRFAVTADGTERRCGAGDAATARVYCNNNLGCAVRRG
eukprot:5044522-Pyramimonas_sp.AAC.1